MKKQTVQNLKVTSSMEFEGMIEVEGDLIEIYGDFDIRWDGQYPEVQIVFASIWKPFGPLTHSQMIVDTTTLVEQIQSTDDGSWYDERCASLIERAQMRCEG